MCACNKACALLLREITSAGSSLRQLTQRLEPAAPRIPALSACE